MSRHSKATLGKAQTPGSDGGSGEMGKVLLSEGEWGWVKLLGLGIVQVMNIPLGGRFNIDDVVEVDVDAMEENPFQVLQGTIRERIYPVRTVLSYKKASDFNKIRTLADKVGGKVEGFMEPRPGHPGLVAIAALAEGHVLLIMRALDLPEGKGWRPNFLEA